MSQLDCSDSRIEEGSQEFHKLYKLRGVLGKGGFGTVFTTIRKKDKLHVVVKEVYKAKIIKKTADGKKPTGGRSYATSKRCAWSNSDIGLV